MTEITEAKTTTGLVPAVDVYLVNSNGLSAQDMAMQLGRAGYSVLVLSTFERLEEEIAKRPPAMVIVDLAFSRDIPAGALNVESWRTRSGKNFPIVWVSIMGAFTSRLAAARAGADAYFTHPLDIDGMLDSLDKLVRSHEQRAFRILVVGANENEAKVYAQHLNAAGMQTRVLDSLLGLFEILDDFRPELILLDVTLPNCLGTDLARLIRQSTAFIDVPIVIVVDSTDVTSGVVGGAGVDEVLIKPISSEYMVKSVIRVTERFHSLRSLILRDSLTGLYNQAAIKEQLAQELRRCERGQSIVSLAMIDIDFFKKVNDTYGHPIGDQVICSLSRLLRDRLRRSDMVGRYGGEEFAVVLSDTDAASAVATLEEIRVLYCTIEHQSGSGTFTSSFSTGVVDTTTHIDVETMFKAADAALYDAKHAGRNCIRRAQRS